VNKHAAVTRTECTYRLLDFYLFSHIVVPLTYPA
jgi:hypothetical protein